MKCLSVRQPWAWLIMTKGKEETRTWRTKHRGPLAIAAGKRFDMDAYKYLRSIGVELPPVSTFDLGKIICTVTLTDVVSFTKDREKFAFCPQYDGFCFLFSDVRSLDVPVPVKGRLGLFEVAL